MLNTMGSGQNTILPQGFYQTKTTRDALETLWFLERMQKMFNKNCLLVRHQQIHVGVKSYKCQVCGKAFCKNVDFGRHMRIHPGEKPCKCVKCEKILICRSHPTCRFTLVRSPMRAVNVKRPSSTTLFFRHSMTHTAQKPCECKECWKRFSTAIPLLDTQGVTWDRKQLYCPISIGT